MNLWKFDYEFDKERLLLEAKNPIGYGPGEGINTERTYYSRGNGEAEVVDKAVEAITVVAKKDEDKD